MRVPKLSLEVLKKLLPKKIRNSHRRLRGDNTEGETIVEQHHRDDDDNDDSTRAPTTKTLKSIMKTPAPGSAPPKTKPPARPPPEDECPICHDPVGVANPEGVTESWTKLYCGHEFGTHCIHTWLQDSINQSPNVNPSCPICRATAKHPCGHLVCPPPFPSVFLQYQQQLLQYQWDWGDAQVAAEHARRSMLMSPSIPQPMQRTQRRRQRRRLTRRAGHPDCPPPPAPPVRYVQVIGECQTCAENAAFDAHMQRLRQVGRRQRQDTLELAASRVDRAEGRATPRRTGIGAGMGGGLKSIIPDRLLKRSSNPVRTTVHSMGFEGHRPARGQSAIYPSSPLTRENLARATGSVRPPSARSRRLSI
ncbi:hypothetical protein F4778DRAFT_40192 [Xylariomycetidae sp. FL2044]|nr:hypothetical protein F4778DRAFT_40192 [Xylariomycetidae sp. FL2044]